MKNNIVRKGCLLGLLSLQLLGGQSAARAALARGTVFEDANRNGVFDQGERGVSGVAVSNGCEVVRTGTDGRYAIELPDKTDLFVIKPGNYGTKVDKLGLPRFYYLNDRTGTEDAAFIFKGVAPTGPLPDSIDFPLYRSTESEAFSVALIADPQAYDTKELTWYARDVASELARQKPAFGIALGDLVGDNLDLQALYAETNSVTGFPWYNVIGNHDLNYMAKTDADADCSFRRVFGPSSYAFEYGKVHFIVLNNVFWKGFSGLKKNGFPKGTDYEGRLRPRQLQFVANYLAGVPSEDLVVVCSHIPMVFREAVKNPFLTPQFPELLALLSKHPHTLSLSGHIHITYSEYFGAESGYKAPGGASHLHLSAPAASGSWYAGPLDSDGLPLTLGRDGTPHGYLWLEFKGSEYHVRFKGVRRSSDEQMRLYAPEVVSDPQEPGKLVVNLYTGNERAQVSCRIDGAGQPLTLARFTANDPAYAALYERSNPLAKTAGYRALPEPLRTDHLWAVELPKGLEPGMHRIDVEAKNSFGDVFGSSTAIRVLSPGSDWSSVDQRGSRK